MKVRVCRSKEEEWKSDTLVVIYVYVHRHVTQPKFHVEEVKK